MKFEYEVPSLEIKLPMTEDALTVSNEVGYVDPLETDGNDMD